MGVVNCSHYGANDLGLARICRYSVHIIEEYTFDWRNWARAVLGLPVEFYMTNALVIVLGLIQAELAPTLAIAPLTFWGVDAYQRHLLSRAAHHPCAGTLLPGFNYRSSPLLPSRNRGVRAGSRRRTPEHIHRSWCVCTRGRTDGVPSSDAPAERWSLLPTRSKLRRYLAPGPLVTVAGIC